MMKIYNYHGTTDTFNIKDKILPPIVTGILREEWRKNYKNKIFFTQNFGQAKKYAIKAAKKYGGNPIVYSIVPMGVINYLKDGEWICDYGSIIAIIPFERKEKV